MEHLWDGHGSWGARQGEAWELSGAAGQPATGSQARATPAPRGVTEQGSTLVTVGRTPPFRGIWGCGQASTSKDSVHESDTCRVCCPLGLRFPEQVLSPCWGEFYPHRLGKDTGWRSGLGGALAFLRCPRMCSRPSCILHSAQA